MTTVSSTSSGTSATPTVSSFLSNGSIPQGSSAEDLTTTTALPDWYTAKVGSAVEVQKKFGLTVSCR